MDLVVNIMILVFSVCLMFVYSWELALITLTMSALIPAYFLGFNKLNQEISAQVLWKVVLIWKRNWWNLLILIYYQTIGMKM